MEITEHEPGVWGVWKPPGHTPLQAIHALKKLRPELKDEPATYAGRLDPMAEGLLLVLTGSAVHRKPEFLALKKTYTAEILFGFETDSFDLLGLPVQSTAPAPTATQVRAALKQFVGSPNLPLPPYSSPPYQGKPLFEHARNGSMTLQTTPTRPMRVHSAQLTGELTSMHSTELSAHIEEKIARVSGDFRQAEIVAAWKRILDGNKTQFPIASIAFQVGSGTYIRSLAYSLGKALGTRACLYSLVRTSVGKYEARKKG
jgi:tRNA pseudouridine(55) synthase